MDVRMSDYPNLWKRGVIQKRIRELAHHRCEQCGMKFYIGTNLAIDVFCRTGNPMVGTVHHIDQNKQNCSLINLVYLCQSCHWILHIYDWTPGSPLLKRWLGIPPKWILERNIPYTENPQLQLFDLREVS